MAKKGLRSALAAERKVCAVDLFCGAGGLTLGLARAGIDVRLGVDVDPSCQFPYEKNNGAKFLLESVEKLRGYDLAPLFRTDEVRLLAGCAPCQTFSKYNQKASAEDDRWWLLLHFSRLVREISPEIVTMENVPGLADQDVFRRFIAELREARYDVFYETVKCADYGVPQTRQRLVLLASKMGPIRLLSSSVFKSRSVTVRSRISHLPALKAGERSKRDRLHQAAALSATNLRRIKASKPGGTWRDWDRSLVADCHKKKLGKTYSGVYGRMQWDQPAPTITTQFNGFGNGRFGHPEQNRALSLREGAILQGFPSNYKFVPPREPILSREVGKLIGNAVPVSLGQAIGASVLMHLKRFPPPGYRVNWGMNAKS